MAKKKLAAYSRNVILAAHKDFEEDTFNLIKVNAHEVRAVATSLSFKKNKSLQDVMDVAVWRCNMTFTSFYLRDSSHRFLYVSALGPVVAA